MKLEIGKRYRLMPFTPETRAEYLSSRGPGLLEEMIKIAAQNKVYTVSDAYSDGWDHKRIKLAEDDDNWTWLESSFAPISSDIELQVK